MKIEDTEIREDYFHLLQIWATKYEFDLSFSTYFIL